MDISVVIPVYKVEPYLRKCVDSILHQTISNYEVILVDDGSPDGCPAICDAYAANHSNVTALHKTNGGLSDARNYGVQHASGDYVVFVDSDDYVDPEYLESLWALHLKYDAEITVQGIKSERENGTLIDQIKSRDEMTVDSKEAIQLMCYGRKIGIFAVAKLYSKHILLNCPFPIGKLHEDIFTTYRLCDQAEIIALGTNCNYHYLKREGSILTSGFSEQHLNALTGANEIIQFMKGKYPDAVKAAYVRLAIESNSLMHRVVQSNQYYAVRKRVLQELNGKWKPLLTASELPVRIKLQLILLRSSAAIYKEVYSHARKLKTAKNCNKSNSEK